MKCMFRFNHSHKVKAISLKKKNVKSIQYRVSGVIYVYVGLTQQIYLLCTSMPNDNVQVLNK